MAIRNCLVFAILLTLSACSNVGEKRSELAAAGFRSIPATTPAQVAKLQSIKSSKLVPLKGKNGTVYVFADHEKKTLMVGTPAQFQKYRALKLRQQKIDEQLLESQANMANVDWESWGPYAGWSWNVASSPY
jgi:hypothetical protein